MLESYDLDIEFKSVLLVQFDEAAVLAERLRGVISKLVEDQVPVNLSRPTATQSKGKDMLGFANAATIAKVVAGAIGVGIVIAEPSASSSLYRHHLRQCSHVEPLSFVLARKLSSLLNSGPQGPSPSLTTKVPVDGCISQSILWLPRITPPTAVCSTSTLDILSFLAFSSSEMLS
ncbi:MAG: hypothetical protein J3Q66DRAFT_359173 [Benniella sp.]|nr:MAG: hypothetical protein J3Q66DRAFT_359173 [Benniella sp.]